MRLAAAHANCTCAQFLYVLRNDCHSVCVCVLNKIHKLAVVVNVN